MFFGHEVSTCIHVVCEHDLFRGCDLLLAAAAAVAKEYEEGRDEEDEEATDRNAYYGTGGESLVGRFRA